LQFCRVRFLRIAAVHDLRSEGPQTALSARLFSQAPITKPPMKGGTQRGQDAK
jgi:hypothetical protein